eukprot:COSAG05_NODE_639_length_8156_cov_122.162840_12_plen_103_part_00
MEVNVSHAWCINYGLSSNAPVVSGADGRGPLPPGGVSALYRRSSRADSRLSLGIAGNPAASRQISNARMQNICKSQSCMASHQASVWLTGHVCHQEHARRDL